MDAYVNLSKNLLIQGLDDWFLWSGLSKYIVLNYWENHSWTWPGIRMIELLQNTES